MTAETTQPWRVGVRGGRDSYTGPHALLDNGLCRHRWANRTTHDVHCWWADGYRTALAEARERVAGLKLDAAWSEDTPEPFGRVRRKWWRLGWGSARAVVFQSVLAILRNPEQHGGTGT